MIFWFTKDKQLIDVEYLAYFCYLLYMTFNLAFVCNLAYLVCQICNYCLFYWFNTLIFFVSNSSNKLYKPNSWLVIKYLDFKMFLLASLNIMSVLQVFSLKPLVFGILYRNKLKLTYNYTYKLAFCMKLD